MAASVTTWLEGIFRAAAGSPKKTLVALALLSALTLGAAASVRIDLSFRPLYLEDPQLKEASEAVYATFGQLADGMVGILVEAAPDGDVLSAESLASLRRVTERVRDLEGVGRVVSPTELRFAALDERGALKEVTLLPSSGAAQRDEVKARQAAYPALSGLVLARDLDKMVVWAALAVPMEQGEVRKQTIDEIGAIVAEEVRPPLSGTLVGYPVVERAYEDIFFFGMLKALGATAVLVTLLLLLFFGRVREVVVALAGTALALPVAFAVMALTGAPITLVSAVLPTLMLVIGVTDALHLLERYRHERRRRPPLEAAVKTMTGLLRPVLWTTLTTSAGFLSLLPASLSLVREFGVVAAVAGAALLGFNLLAVPASLVLLDPAAVRERRTLKWLRRSLVLVGRWTEDHRWPVVVVGIAFFGALLAFVPQLSVSQPFNRDVAPSHPVRAAQTSLEASFPGFQGPEVEVSRRDGEPLTAEDLQVLQQLGRALGEVGDVHAVVSIIDSVPAGTSATDRQVILSLASVLGTGGELRTALLSDDQRRALVLIRTGDIGTARARALLDEAADRIDALLARAPHLNARLLGSWVRAQRGMGLLIDDLLKSVLLASGLVFVALLVVFGRRREVLVALLANVAPVLGTLGVMAAAGVPMKIGTSIAVVVALGIAVDDTLHLVARLPARGPIDRKHIRRAVHDAGAAMILTTVVLVVGFLCLGWVGLSVVTEMGRVGAAALALALFADLLWLPALLLCVRGPGDHCAKPWKTDRNL